ncbi:DMT family transporter [Aliiroseovarius halocynthiae]|uniref:DMT family transporter n=2 Tax=Aliiroseovarius halocynthiae TaxID=985055 RepID=A0A545SXR5_9RHOB|nr:DMT family transporter [Aliiroseovarius halocynthiae]
MAAFAANSLLNRAGLAEGAIGPAGFALIRVISGAVMLWVLLASGRKKLPQRAKPDWISAGALATYLLGFSFAYVALDAGLGALVLFAIVQVTMFAGALRIGNPIPALRWGGMIASMLGLAYLVWPSDDVQLPFLPLVLMAVSAIGWGTYSLIGRRSAEPLQATAWNFIYATPIVAIVTLPLAWEEVLSTSGALLAVTSGAITSGLGYALWYRVLPQLTASAGALVQLSVPVIALGAGALFLGEVVDPREITASALVLGGIAFGLIVRK